MDSDLLLTVGLVLAAFSIPSLLSAFSESRPPRTGAILILTAGVLIMVALANKPGGYAVNDIPQTVYRVIGRFVN
ncbi:MAG: hypothetical protein U1D35_15415 [Paracoccaceae bacterium]|nr:hypothetical protein [Paracoccaceae bacterium]